METNQDVKRACAASVIVQNNSVVGPEMALHALRMEDGKFLIIIFLMFDNCFSR